jgi:hypothetical protein
MQEVKAPESYDLEGKVSLFLAGSIEQGKAEPWQSRLVESLADMDLLLILNPRRSDWDASWTQSKDDPQFRGQVVWELAAQETADVIAMYFDPATKSPITLLELGLFAEKNIVVFCPEGFYRKGNVDIVCERYDVAQADSWDDFVAKVRQALDAAEKDRLEGAWK